MTAPRHGEASDDSDAREDTDHIASALSQRCFSLARRILGGAGMATMVAHTMISAGESPEKWTCDLQPTCATVTHLDARAGLSSADGRVGACQRIECVHNDKLMCTAQQVAISDAASCTAYQAR